MVDNLTYIPIYLYNGFYIYTTKISNVERFDPEIFSAAIDIGCCYCCSMILTKAINIIKPIKVYSNLKTDKDNLIKDHKKKVGVYCLVNLINGNFYVGSSHNIASRMQSYLSDSYLGHYKNKNMPITKALLKYGQINFAVLILEYVKMDLNVVAKQDKKPELLIAAASNRVTSSSSIKNFLSIRETYYIKHLLPYYNVLTIGYSSLGYKHTDTTKQLLSQLALNRTHSEKTKVLISKTLTGENNPFYLKKHTVDSKLKISQANTQGSVYIYDSFKNKNLVLILPSIRNLTTLIKSNHNTIVNVINNESLFRGEWYIKTQPYNITDTPSISEPYSAEGTNFISCIINNSHIKKAIFVYNAKKELINIYPGVKQAKKDLHISHEQIKLHAHSKQPYKGYLFSYERLG